MKAPRNAGKTPGGRRARASTGGKPAVTSIPAPPPSQLSVSLLGQPHIELDGVAVKFDRRKALALLTFLAVTGECHAREKLASLFWPDEDQSAALASLRNCLTSLRHAIGPEWIDATDGKIGLCRAEGLWLDVKQFGTLLRRYEDLASREGGDDAEALGILTEMAGLYRTNFLTQFTIEGADQFGEWKFFQAEDLRRKFAAVLERLTVRHARAGEIDVAIAYAHRRLALDPLDETAHRALMRLYAAAGRRSIALRQFASCGKVLRDELQVEPEEPTAELAAAIRSRASVEVIEPGWDDSPVASATRGGVRAGRPAGRDDGTRPPFLRRRWVRFAAAAVLVLIAAAVAAVVAGPRLLPGTKTIAVLPFDVRGSPSPASPPGSFADLLAAALSGADRARILVPPRIDEAWADDPVRAGRDLDAPWVVSGVVVFETGRVRITARLTDAQTGVLAWARTWDGSAMERVPLERTAAGEAAGEILYRVLLR